MLPDINAEQRMQTGRGQKRILIGARNDLESVVLLVVAEPAPAGSLHAHRSSAQAVDHVLMRAKVSFDEISQRTSWLASSLRAQGLPENGVVQMTTAVESQSRTQGDDSIYIILGKPNKTFKLMRNIKIKNL